MRTRTGHGPNDWTPNVPSEPRPAEGWQRGSLIQGAHGPVEQGRLQSVAHRKAKRLSTGYPQRPDARSETVDAIGDKTLDGDARNLQNQGVKPQIPEVPTVSVRP